MFDRWLRHHPKVLALKFRPGVKRAEMANAIEDFICGHVGKLIDPKFNPNLNPISFRFKSPPKLINLNSNGNF